MNIDVFSQNDLILFCMLKIEKTKEDCTFERLVYECFTTFPKRFSFYTYPLPDSIKLDRQLRGLRNLNLITGNNTYGFKLTDKGHKLAINLYEIIKSSSSKKIKNININKVGRGRKEEIMINKIVSSSIYFKYEINSKTKLSVDEIRVVFFGTLETSLKSLLDNIEYIEQIAKKSQNKTLVEFINKCKLFIKEKLKE